MTGRKGRSGRRSNRPIPVNDAELPEPPDDISEFARAKFCEVRDLIAEVIPGRLTAADQDLLTLYATTWEQMTEAARAIGQTPYSEVESRTGKRLEAHPATRVFRDAARQLQSLMRQLGLTPLARKNLGAAAGSPKGNAFARLHKFPSGAE